MRLAFAFSIALLALATGCGPSDSRTALLRLKAAEGDRYEMIYSSKTHFVEKETEANPGANENSSITVHRILTCKKVDQENTTWDSKTQKVDFTAEDQLGGQAGLAALKQQGKTESIVRDERGVIQGQPKTSPLEPEFPIQKVQVGDAWRSDAILQGFKVPMIFEIAGFETVDGIEAVKISGKIESSQNVEMAKPIEAWFDLKTGWPIKGSGEFRITPRPGALLTMRLEMKRK